MKKITMKKITILSLMFFITSLFMTAQTTWTVDNTVGANAQFNNLQDAIDDVNVVDGDILYVHASSISYGDIVQDKSLSLIGYGHSNPTKNTIIGIIRLEDNASNSKFRGLSVTDIICENSDLQLQNLIFEYNNIGELDLGNSTFYLGANNVMIRGNVVGEIFGDGTNTTISNNIILIKVYVRLNFISVEIKNNVFFPPSSGSSLPVVNYNSASGSITVQNNIMYSSGSTNFNSPGVIFENCLTYSFNAGTHNVLNGTNNFDNIDPQFVAGGENDIYDPETDDFHLLPGSPIIGQGAGGVDIGLYPASSFVFNNFGCPVGIPKVTITSITTAVEPGGNVDVTIQSSSN